MNYDFPIIEHINDVLPAISGYDEFIVADKGDYKIVNYVVSKENTFNMEDGYGEIRRELRGIAFDKNGKILSRPFHKFFNLNERNETLIENISFLDNHTIFTKMDGSMIRPLLLDGGLFLATKMGITDIAMDAYRWLKNYKHRVDELMYYSERGITPIFEWISPNNRIVIKYDNEDLVLLALRDNVTGAYSMPENSEFTIVNSYGSVTNVNEYISSVRNDTEREGDVIRFDSGHMIKIKADQYVRIHKVKDMISSERMIVSMILNNDLDDVMPLLDKEDKETVFRTEHEFWNGYNAKVEYLNELYERAVSETSSDRKKIAVDFLPKNAKSKDDWKYVFSMLDGKDLNKLMYDAALGAAANATKYEAFKTWMKT